MLRYAVAGLIVGLTIGGGAFAQVKNMPPELAAELKSVAEAAASAPRFAFDVEYRADGEVLRAGFDPSRPEPWRLQSPEPLSKTQKAIWDGIRQDAEADKEKLVDDPGKFLTGEARPEAGDGAIYSFGFNPVEDPEMRKFADKLRVYWLGSAGSTTLDGYRIRNLEPFKPMPVARLTTFQLEAEFARLPGDDALYTAKQSQMMEGSAMMRDFRQAVVETVFNIRIVEPADVVNAAGK